jgi:hypothetical protein
MAKWASLVVVVLVMVACGGSRRSVGTDAGSITVVDSGVRVDAGGGGGVDSGGGTGDRCATNGMGAEALANLGCNGGFASGTPAANADYGTCTVAADPMTNPAGSCASANAACVPDAEGSTTGICRTFCPVAATYISTGGCPTGSRCFTLTDDTGETFGLCFRDCDASHACPTGMTCDAEGSCY